MQKPYRLQQRNFGGLHSKQYLLQSELKLILIVYLLNFQTAIVNKFKIVLSLFKVEALACPTSRKAMIPTLKALFDGSNQ